jgi:hypothetical protein
VLSFNPVNEVCNLDIVISKQNHKPLLDSIPVVPFTLNTTASPEMFCKGESSQLSVTVTGGSGIFTYLWSPDTYLDNPAIANPVSLPDADIDYTVTVDDGTYSVTSSPVHLTVKPAPPTPVITLVLDTLVSDAQSGNQWYRYQEIIPGAIEPKYFPIASGDYSVIVTDTATDCSSLQSNIIQYYFTGVDKLLTNQNVMIYPNPSRDYVNISYYLPERGSVMISLIDAVGKELKILENKMQQDPGHHLSLLDGHMLDKGLYYVKVQTKNYSVNMKLILTK